jgi:hypothetical protein
MNHREQFSPHCPSLTWKAAFGVEDNLSVAYAPFDIF